MADILSIEEREFVQNSRNAHVKTGFAPNPQSWMSSIYEKPVTSASLECSHILHSSLIEAASGYPSIEYRLWQEAGKHAPPLPDRPDESYNSNVWRNFRQAFGLGPYESARGKKPARDPVIDEHIAAIYPVNVPKPSSLGVHSYSRYVEDSELFNDERRKQLAIHRLKEDESKFRKLRALSDARNPPIDKRGNILPPQGYRKYEPLFLPHEDLSKPLITTDMQPDMFGNLVSKRHKPKLWKLTYRTNNPRYNEAMEYAGNLGQLPRLHPPAVLPPRF